MVLRKCLLALCILVSTVYSDEYSDAVSQAGAVPVAQDYYTQQNQAYLQNRDSGYAPAPQHYGGQGYAEQDPLIPNLYPTAILGGLGALGMMYFKTVIDQSYNKSLHAFEALHHEVDHRLEHLEEMIENRGKETKKLDFKTKMLCKFANLFNNPTYEICNQGFDGGQVVGPTGGSHSGPGYGYLEGEEGAQGGTAAGDGSSTTSTSTTTSAPPTGTGTGDDNFGQGDTRF